MRPILLVIALGACNGGEIEVPENQDKDGDGFVGAVDCDDNDASVFPGADETCDGVDEDCDGTVDDGVGTAYFADADRDGFGDPDATTLSCSGPPPDTADNGDDCDDTDARINPAAAEVCDGLDNDCDDRADWGLAVPAEYATIRGALGASRDGDQICVAPGTYKETLDFGGRNVWVNGYGGSAVTTIDGGGKGSVVSFDTHETAAARLTGFTITGGAESEGGGIYIRRASPSLQDLVITGNRCEPWEGGCRGGGLYASGSKFTLTDARVEGNRLDGSIDPDYYAYSYGGGMHLDGSSPVLTNVRIADNEITTGSNAYYNIAYGAGLYAAGGAPVLDHVEIVGNQVTGSATVIYAYGVGMYYQGTGGSLDRVLIADNHGRGYQFQGGGAYLYNSDPVLTNVAIVNNDIGTPTGGTALGGGMYLYYSLPDLVNVDIVGNDVTGEVARGGGMYLNYYNVPQVISTAICHNSAAEGGAIYVADPYPGYETEMSYSNLYGNGDRPVVGWESPVGSAGNLAVDPEYVSTSGSDGELWDLSLGRGSGMIDMGDPYLKDRDGSPADIGSRGGPAGW